MSHAPMNDNALNGASVIVPWRGIVTGIHIAPTGGAPMVATKQVTAVAGRGLEGDRCLGVTEVTGQ